MMRKILICIHQTGFEKQSSDHGAGERDLSSDQT